MAAWGCFDAVFLSSVLTELETRVGTLFTRVVFDELALELRFGEEARGLGCFCSEAEGSAFCSSAAVFVSSAPASGNGRHHLLLNAAFCERVITSSSNKVRSTSTWVTFDFGRAGLASIPDASMDLLLLKVMALVSLFGSLSAHISVMVHQASRSHRV